MMSPGPYFDSIKANLLDLLGQSVGTEGFRRDVAALMEAVRDYGAATYNDGYNDGHRNGLGKPPE